MLLALVLLLLLGTVHAAPCSVPGTYTNGADCVTNSGGVCHWAGVAAECRDGTRPTCPDGDNDGVEANCPSFGCVWDADYGDCMAPPAAVDCSTHTTLVACTGDAACTYNSLNGKCYNTLAACSSLSQVNCSRRSDCSWTGSACDDTPSGCGVHATGIACLDNNCFWDYYTTSRDPATGMSGGGQCYQNLQEVNLLFSCSHWSGYPYTSLSQPACSSHGCAQTGATCGAVTSGSETADNTGYTLSATIGYSIVNPHVPVQAGPLRFIADFVVPMSTFWSFASPRHHAILIGAPTTALQLAPFLAGPGPCTSLGAAMPAYEIVAYADPAALQTYFTTRTTATGTLALFNDTGNADQNAVRGMIGTWAYGFTTTTIPSSDLHIRLNGALDAWVTDCTDVTRTITPTYTLYDVPLTIVQRSASGTIGSTQRFAITVGTSGTVQVSATSRVAMSATLEDVRTVRASCPAGQRLMRWDVVLSFTNAYDTTQRVGLRTAVDVQMETPEGEKNNCFGTQATAVTPPTSCPSAVCVTRVSFETRCTPMPLDGTAFQLCSNQLAAARIIDMGSDIAYPTAWNYKQTFFIKPHSWDATIGITDPDASPVGQDPTGVVPDEVPVTINTAFYPDANLTYAFEVRGGLLPTPDAPFSERLELSSANGTSVIDLRNRQLFFERTLTLLIWIVDPDQRGTFVLHLHLPSLRIYALSATGAPLGLTPLTWDDIESSTQRSPRDDVCPTTCTALATVPGSDGFAIPVTLLRALLPANGYRVVMDYNITWPEIEATRRRRLLQVLENELGTLEMSFLVPDAPPVDPTQGWDLGSTDASTITSLSVVGGVGLGWGILAYGLVAFVL